MNIRPPQVVNLFAKRWARVGLIVVIAISCAVIIVQMVLRPWASPNKRADTHFNFDGPPPAAYSRSPLTYVDQVAAAPSGRVPSQLAQAATDQGEADYLGYGCANCHGIDGAGGFAAPAVAGDSERRITTLVRQGPGNMPAYTTDGLSDADLSAIAAYISGLPKQPTPTAAPVTPTATPWPSPTATPTPIPSPTATPVPGATPTPTQPAATPTATPAPKPTVDAARFAAAKQLFQDVGCDLCHGLDAKGTSGGPALTGLTASKIESFVRNPQASPDSPYTKQMKPFSKSVVSDQDLQELIYYILNLPQ